MSQQQPSTPQVQGRVRHLWQGEVSQGLLGADVYQAATLEQAVDGAVEKLKRSLDSILRGLGRR